MGRSGETGRNVESLTPDELRRERLRCQTLAKLYSPKVARLLLKRLAAIDRRLAELNPPAGGTA